MESQSDSPKDKSSSPPDSPPHSKTNPPPFADPPPSSPPPSPPQLSPPPRDSSPPPRDSSPPPSSPPPSESSPPPSSPPPSNSSPPSSSPPPVEPSPPPRSSSSSPTPSPPSPEKQSSTKTPPPKSDTPSPPQQSSPSPPKSDTPPQKESPSPPQSSDSSKPASPPTTQSPPSGGASGASPPPNSTNSSPTPPGTVFSPPTSATNSSQRPSSSSSPVTFVPPSTNDEPAPPVTKSPPSSNTSSNSSNSSGTGNSNSSSTGNSSGTGNSNPSSNSNSSNTSNAAIIAAVAIGGALLIVMIILLIVCVTRKKKKKNPYYMTPDAGPRGNQYGYTTADWQQWNETNQSVDHVVKLPPPPGMMGTPIGTHVGGWGAPPPPNMSSQYMTSGPHGTPLPPPSPNLGLGLNKNTFTLEELAAATGGFSQENLLGQGGFGFVHKGVLPNGKEVAIKSLKSGSGQGEREFQAEVEIISRVHHRHLVSLVGYCIASGQRMLVYEFVANKTLEFHLYGKGQPTMNWETRLRIALGSAKGLAYLHEDCHPRIIHRDIKAANILLDDNFEAMVADFGLAKLNNDNNTHVSTRIMGTFGYLAPEYASSGKLTEKSDVFSYGVMLLELITGRRPVDTTSNVMEDSLADWARPIMTQALENGNYDELVDPRLENNYVPDEMARMVGCASASIRHSARKRPRMSQIVRALEGDSSMEDLNDVGKPRLSSANATYDAASYDADMSKFKKTVPSSQEFDSSEYTSNDSREMGQSARPNKQKI